MRRLFLLSFLMMFFMNSAQAVEFKPLELPKNTVEKNEVNVSNVNPEAPKALLHDESYKIKGRIEYNDDGVLFLKDEDIEGLKLKVKEPKKFAKQSVFIDENLFQKVEEQRRIEAPIVDEYLGKPFLGGVEYKAGKNITYGTTFGTDVDMAQVEYRTKLFARYDNKFIGFMTAVGKDAYTSSGRQMDSFFLVPELKLGQAVSIVDMFKANPEYDRFRNEVLLQYRPKIKQSRENVQLEAGLSQTSYYKTGEMIYQFSVSTKFKF